MGSGSFSVPGTKRDSKEYPDGARGGQGHCPSRHFRVVRAVHRERTSKQCVAYAGPAPQEQTSGTSLRRKDRLFATGNKILRCALYMGAVGAIRTDPESKDLYARIVGAGKPK